MDPRPDEVVIEDIASALSRLCRYGGHATRHYSVAEHSVRMVWMLRKAGESETVQRQALFHDATEAYLCDIPRPVKPFITNYREIEELNWFAIADRFGLGVSVAPIVDILDRAMPSLEMVYVMPRTYNTGIKPKCLPDTMRFVGWPAWMARMLYLREYRRLYARRQRMGPSDSRSSVRSDRSGPSDERIVGFSTNVVGVRGSGRSNDLGE